MDNANIDCAREMIIGGADPVATAEWLARQCPEDFKDADEAAAAIGAPPAA